ncbi:MULTISPECIES: helix-turn-helix domain-containing protein [unclassified Egicoccus]|uniref:helix-turn-helix domain-containing protein n=1 Tax=unclassified Egicoccus TaxID=2635606 RepID=UPI00359CDA16
MGKRGVPLTDNERQRILELVQQGKSYGQVARETGRSQQTVGRIARAAGVAVDQSNLARVVRAQETRRAYGAEARAERLAKLHGRIDRIIDRMGEPHTAFSFGGKDNDYNERRFDEPTSDALRQYAAAVAQLVRAEVDILKYDERGDDDSADVDRWLDHVTGASP